MYGNSEALVGHTTFIILIITFLKKPNQVEYHEIFYETETQPDSINRKKKSF